MRRLTWNDNIGTEGWTQVHGLFSIDDLRWLRAMAPRGDMVPTFYHPRLAYASWERVEAFFEGQPGGAERGFYFAFPEDREGMALLVALQLKGLGPRMRGAHG